MGTETDAAGYLFVQAKGGIRRLRLGQVIQYLDHLRMAICSKLLQIIRLKDSYENYMKDHVSDHDNEIYSVCSLPDAGYPLCGSGT